MDSLRAIAMGLKPECGANNLDLCTAQQKKRLNNFMDMPLDDLDAQIKQKDTQVTQYEREYQELVKKLQQTFETAKARREQKRNYLLTYYFSHEFGLSQRHFVHISIISSCFRHPYVIQARR